MKRLSAFFLLLFLLFSSACAQTARPMVGVAWVSDAGWESCLNACMAIEEAGGTAVLLGQVHSTAAGADEADEHGMLTAEAAQRLRQGGWAQSNAQEVLQGLKAVVFTGGEDVSPSLYHQPWHGIADETQYHAARDISDYLLMSYCLDNGVAVLGLCRGMQVLAVASGAEMIQDLPAYWQELGLAYAAHHRVERTQPVAYRDYAAHDVQIAPDSLLFGIAGSNRLKAVPSLHHQAVRSVEGTPLRVTGVTDAGGVEIIEAVERTDGGFALGVQFHPEAAVMKNLYGMADAAQFMPLDQAIAFFRAIVSQAQ